MRGPYVRPMRGSKKEPEGRSFLAGDRIPGLARRATKHVLGKPLATSPARKSHHRLSQGGEDVSVFGAQFFGAILSEQQGAQLLASLPKARHSLHQLAKLGSGALRKTVPLEVERQRQSKGRLGGRLLEHLFLEEFLHLIGWPSGASKQLNHLGRELGLLDHRQAERFDGVGSPTECEQGLAQGKLRVRRI